MPLPLAKCNSAQFEPHQTTFRGPWHLTAVHLCYKCRVQTKQGPSGCTHSCIIQSQLKEFGPMSFDQQCNSHSINQVALKLKVDELWPLPTSKSPHCSVGQSIVADVKVSQLWPPAPCQLLCCVFIKLIMCQAQIM